MLFDLRSRRRKNTVRVIYSLLSAVMIVGLVAFGVGTGTSGLFGGNNNSGGSNNANNSGLVTKAEAAVKKNPDSASAWSSLFYANYANATSGSNVSGSVGELTKSGVAAMKQTANAWEKYLALSDGKPSFVNAINAGKMYVDLGLYTNKGEFNSAATAWEYAISALPQTEYASLVNQYTCLALSAYAGGQTTTGDQAGQKTVEVAKLAKLPKDQITGYGAMFKNAKTSASEAKSYAAASCSTLTVS